jgi:hypothetical protein
MNIYDKALKPFTIHNKLSKMNRFFLIFALLFCILFSQGQKDIRNYYKYVNKAELAICKSKYLTASKYYEKAFQTGICFQKDLRNAFTVDYKFTGKESNALIYTHKLAQRGFFAPLIDSVKDVKLYAQIKQIQDTTQIIYDRSLLKQLDTLTIIDQSYRKNGFAYKIENRHVTDSLDLINYNIWLGFYNINDERVKQTLSIYFFNTPILLLRHNIPFQRFPEEILWEQVQNGYLDVRDYLEIYGVYIGTIGNTEQQETYAKIPFCLAAIANKTLFGLCPKKDSPKLRKPFYLNSPKDEMKKNIYQFYHGTKDFNLVRITLYGSPCSENAELKLKSIYDDFKMNKPDEYKKNKYFTLTNPEWDCE